MGVWTACLRSCGSADACRSTWAEPTSCKACRNGTTGQEGAGTNRRGFASRGTAGTAHDTGLAAFCSSTDRLPCIDTVAARAVRALMRGAWAGRQAAAVQRHAPSQTGACRILHCEPFRPFWRQLKASDAGRCWTAAGCGEAGITACFVRHARCAGLRAPQNAAARSSAPLSLLSFTFGWAALLSLADCTSICS